MIDASKKYTSGGHPVTHLHRAPDGWPSSYPWRGIVNGQDERWRDDGGFYAKGNSLLDLTEVREPLQAKVLVTDLQKPYNIVDSDGIDVPNGWRIIEMIEVMPANNPPPTTTNQ
jgi:hypothetical protein